MINTESLIYTAERDVRIHDPDFDPNDFLFFPQDFVVAKLRENAKIPAKAHETDCCWDLFYCPDPKDLITGGPGSDGCKLIEPGDSILIPTGISVYVPRGYCMKIQNKSGISFKRHLLVGGGIIDPGYSGEIFVNVHNTGNKIQYLEVGEKVAQFYVIKLIDATVKEIPLEEMTKLHEKSKRQAAGYGSSGSK